MFKRRQKANRLASWIDSVRAFFWPRGGWARLWRQIIWRMNRMPASSHALALGFASGAFISFTPLWGFHFLLAALIAWILRGNILASALGTVVGNPFTFPLIFWVNYIVGMFLLHGRWVSWEEVSVPSNPDELADLFWPLMVGSVPMGLFGAVVSYMIVFWIIRAYRARKSKLRNRFNGSAP